MPRAIWTTAITATIVVFSWLPTAHAHGQIQIQVQDSAGRPLEGRVTARGPETRTCQTTAGRCTLTLRFGTYQLTLAPSRGGAPPPRTLRVSSTATQRIVLRATAQTTAARATGVTATTTSVTSMGGTTATKTPSLRGTTATQVTGLRRVGALRTRTGSTTAIRPPTGTTSGSTSTTTVTPTTMATATSTVTATQTGTVQHRDLGRGSRVVAQGQVLDAAGRPADATVTVSQNDRVVGEARTTAGRFTIYDLARGTYQVAVRGPRGSGTGTLTIGATTVRVAYRVR